MSPADYLREIVLPTVAELRANPTSRRRAYLAAIVVYHLRDYLAEALTPLTGEPKADRKAVVARAEKIDAAMRTALPGGAFDVVRGVANGSKHATTRGVHAVPFTAGADFPRPPAFIGVMAIGISRIGDTIGGREVPHEGGSHDLAGAIEATLAAFLAAYPEQLGAGRDGAAPP